MLGYGRGETVGRDAFELVHPDDQVGALEGFESTASAADSRPLPTLVRLLCKDGSWLQAEIIGSNCMEVGDLDGLLLNIRDVSTSMRTDAALRESEEHHRLIVELDRGAAERAGHRHGIDLRRDSTCVDVLPRHRAS